MNISSIAPTDETRVNTTTAGDQLDPSVATFADGSYVVTWTSDSQDGLGLDVYSQRFNAAGVGQGEVLASTTTGTDQYSPSVATFADGSYVVTWVSWSQHAAADPVHGRHIGRRLGRKRVGSPTLGVKRRRADLAFRRVAGDARLPRGCEMPGGEP